MTGKDTDFITFMVAALCLSMTSEVAAGIIGILLFWMWTRSPE